MKIFFTYYILIIILGGAFLTSKCFVNIENDVKFYFVVVLSLLLLIICSLRPSGLMVLFASIRSIHFCIGVSLLCLMLSFQGLAQYEELILSRHIAFPITGSFENPAGFVAVLCLLFPYPLFLCFQKSFSKRLRLSFMFSCFITFLTIVLSESRSGTLSVFSTVIVMSVIESKVVNYLKSHRKFLVSLFIVFIISIYGLYILKKDSADGRILIWNICWDIFCERPFIGHGIYGFQTVYMDYQAAYFVKHPNSSYMMLADNVIHPFNEWIKIAVNFGIIGLLMITVFVFLLCRNLLQFRGRFASIGLSILVSVIILGTFSYPFHYALVCFLTSLVIVFSFSLSSYMKVVSSSPFRILLSSFLCVVLIVVLRMMLLDIKWAEIYRHSLDGQSEKMLSHYASMMPEMKYNPLFLYNYSVELNYSNRYKESQEIAKRCKALYNDYDVQLLIADNYANMVMLFQALSTYRHASNMIPCRLVPLEAMMSLYLNLSDTVHATQIAQEILSKQIKVPSEEVIAIRDSAWNLRVRGVN